MSVIGGPNNPISNGLVYALDFKNNRCYVSGSNSARSLTFTTLNTIVTGSNIYQIPALINGLLQFNVGSTSTTGSWLSIPQNQNFINWLSGSFTLQFVASSGRVAGSSFVSQQSTSGSRFVSTYDTTTSVGYYLESQAAYVSRGYPNVSASVLAHCTIRYSNGTYDCFINGTPVSASALDTISVGGTNSGFTGLTVSGKFNPNVDLLWSGSLGNFYLYNRPLSNTEIQSNYTLASREYGLPTPPSFSIDENAYLFSQTAGITSSAYISALDTFVRGLKSASLWDKMVGIYPFLGGNNTLNQLNLKESSLAVYPASFTGSWSSSFSGSRNNNTASYATLTGFTPSTYHPLINTQSFHMAYLSYDTPANSGSLMGATLPATGGTIFVSGSRVYHAFRTTGTSSFTVNSSKLSNVEVMVVAGGGGGGVYGGGAGGAGGLVYSSSFTLTTGSTQVIVGAGGTGSSAASAGQSGQNSIFGSAVAIGGGGGGRLGVVGLNGGSGGSGDPTGGSGTPGQGNNGGGYFNLASGGGGGAGSAGVDGVSGKGGNGGSGSFYPQFASIGGFPAGWFAGGGGGCYFSSAAGTGSGGIGGGGNGGYGDGIIPPQAGRTNTGGGGGASWNVAPGADGGSGIVIVSYDISPLTGSGTSLYTDGTSIGGAINNEIPSTFFAGGPLGLVMTSRTGSRAYSVSKNKVIFNYTSAASSSISNNILLNAVNVNGTASFPIQNNVAYASVGAGLTNDETRTYYDLVNTFQTSLGRGVSNPGAFITLWDTRLTGSGTSNSSSIVLPLYGTQAITASWGDGTTSNISSSTQAERTHSYATPGIYTVIITGSGQGFRFNNGGDKTKLLDIGQWGNIPLSITNTFSGCSNLIATAPDPLILNSTDIQYIFNGCSKFNGYVDNWNTSNVTSMGYGFYGATIFNQSIGSWNTSKVTNFGAMFQSQTAFNNGGSDTIKNWNVASASVFDSMFDGATSFNQPIGSWNVSSATSMPYMFRTATAFNQNIGSWDISKVTNMTSMFQGATTFNNSGSNSINNWRPISCSNFSSMFSSATAFNQPIGNWPLSASNINMSSMFNNADAFNQNIGAWDVSRVTNMSGMFVNTALFNNSGSSDINNWRPISCSNFNGTFAITSNFNQPIGNWPLSASNINMTTMFYLAAAFNQPLGTWDTSNVTLMTDMFNRATAFNQNIGSWNVSNVTNMNGMFNQASAFNQDIGSWNVGNVTNFGDFMTGKTSANYSYLHTIYDGWINYKLQPQRTITFNTIKYSGSAAEGRGLLARTYNTASITGYSNDGGLLAITCSANHNVIVGNKVFISGSSYSAINGVQTVTVAGSPTTLTFNVVYDPTATGGDIITGYGWTITDGGPV